MLIKGRVGLFLHQMRTILSKRELILVEREASLNFLAKRGMTAAELKTRVLELSSLECFDGPEEDRDSKFKEFTVAEFCPTWNNEKIYLKISICSEKVVCKCLSVKPFTERSAE